MIFSNKIETVKKKLLRNFFRVRRQRGEPLKGYAQGIGSLIERLEVRFIFHFSRVFNKIIFESILKPKTNTNAHQSGKKLASNFFF